MYTQCINDDIYYLCDFVNVFVLILLQIVSTQTEWIVLNVTVILIYFQFFSSLYAVLIRGYVFHRIFMQVLESTGSVRCPYAHGQELSKRRSFSSAPGTSKTQNVGFRTKPFCSCLWVLVLLVSYTHHSLLISTSQGWQLEDSDSPL